MAASPEKAQARKGEGPSAALGLQQGRESPARSPSSPSLGRELMRGVHFIYCRVLSLYGCPMHILMCQQFLPGSLLTLDASQRHISQQSLGAGLF